MKKKHLKYAVLCFGLASMLAFAGCGSKGDDATTANPTETEATRGSDGGDYGSNH